jgi:hypothetical protein
MVLPLHLGAHLCVSVCVSQRERIRQIPCPPLHLLEIATYLYGFSWNTITNLEAHFEYVQTLVEPTSTLPPSYSPPAQPTASTVEPLPY